MDKLNSTQCASLICALLGGLIYLADAEDIKKAVLWNADNIDKTLALISNTKSMAESMVEMAKVNKPLSDD